ncbi:MAG TPA: hypothetical protein VGR57_11905 [Ktedonobacterales bacterium]|nr:hypothetical protein [Ktedonobacterales bacterium]
MELRVFARRSLAVVLLLVASVAAVILACAGGTLVHGTGIVPIVIHSGGGSSQPGR